MVQVMARSMSSWSIICVYQEMTFSGGDVGTSSLINFLGGRLPSRRSRAKMAPDPVGDGHGERGWDWALLAGVSLSIIRIAHAQSVRSL